MGKEYDYDTPSNVVAASYFDNQGVLVQLTTFDHSCW